MLTFNWQFLITHPRQRYWGITLSVCLFELAFGTYGLLFCMKTVGKCMLGLLLVYIAHSMQKIVHNTPVQMSYKRISSLTDETILIKGLHTCDYTTWGCAWRRIIQVRNISREIIRSAGLWGIMLWVDWQL